MTKKIRVLIADDHTMVRQGLSQICDAEADLEVIGQAANGEEACRLADRLHPHVVIMDINMPVLDGVQATQRITAAYPEMGVIILTMYRQDEHVFEAIKAGARAYLLKEADSDELLSAIRAVAAGEALLDPAIAHKIIDEFRRLLESAAGRGGTFTPLTPRDLDILRLVAQGMDNNAIAGRLFLSEKTVRNRLSGIFEALHVSNRTQAALYALRKGLARLDDAESDPSET
ncbi:MAG: response regulator transcription factor [Chloroflexi bacterium]|nr:response regulator transcription factor [Chloroflexota bacterium]